VELEEVCDEVLSLQTVPVDFPQQKSKIFLTVSRKVLATVVDNWSGNIFCISSGTSLHPWVQQRHSLTLVTEASTHTQCI